MLDLLDTGQVGAVVTDPPCLVERSPDAPSVSCRASAIRWVKPIVRECARVLRPGGSLVFMGSPETTDAWTACASRYLSRMAELIVLWNTGKKQTIGFESLHTSIHWYVKRGARRTFNCTTRSIPSNILVCRKVSRGHPGEQPVGLTNFLISLLTYPHDLIVDPFCGSGSTLVSAVQCGRGYVGCDLDESCVQMTERRLEHAELEESDPVYLWINGRMEVV